MCDINAKIMVSQNNSDKKKEVELNMSENEATSVEAQTCKDEHDSERNQGNPTDGTGKIDFKCCWCPVVLFILLMVIFIGGIIYSVVFIKNICVPFTDSSNFVACIQYTVSLALVLAAVIITSISLIKAAKWLIKVDLIKQVLNSSCNAEQKKKYCDTLADL